MPPKKLWSCAFVALWHLKTFHQPIECFYIYNSIVSFTGFTEILFKVVLYISSVVERDVHEVLTKSTIHQRLNVRFENKARLRPVRARTVQIRHQIDLEDMQRLRTIYKGKTYKYVLSILDVFSRYHWLVPLQTKKSSHVARELVRIYRKQGPHASFSTTKGENLKAR